MQAEMLKIHKNNLKNKIIIKEFKMIKLHKMLDVEPDVIFDETVAPWSRPWGRPDKKDYCPRPRGDEI